MENKEMTLRKFSEQLSLELGKTPVIEMGYVLSEKQNKNKVKRKHQYCEKHKFKSEDYRILLIPFDDNTVEIHTLNTYEYGKGKGTEVLNKILDVCDRMNINLKLDPFGFIEGKDSPTYDRWLKEWYKSFGFVEKPFDRFGALIYKPEQNLQMAA